MKKGVIFLINFLLLNLCQGQTTFMQGRGLKLNLFTGYHFAANQVWSTKQSMDGIVTGIDLGLIQWGIKKETFKQIYGTPRIGIDLRVIRMNNPDTFGYCLALLPYFEVELYKKPKWNIQSKISFGLNGNTMGYNSTKNYDNRAISSNLNFGFDLGLVAHITLKKNLELNLGTGLYHVSNGSLKMPNGGINITYVNAGLSYYPKVDIDKDFQKQNLKVEGKKFFYMGYGAFAYREQGYFNYIRKFWVFSMVNQGMYRVNKLYSLGLGLDAFYDATQPLTHNSTNKVYDIPENKKYYLALGFANRLDLGRFFVPAGIYRYAYNNKFVEEPVYLRFGLGYQINKHLFTGVFFKGTVNKEMKLQSDFMEWSLGFRL